MKENEDERTLVVHERDAATDVDTNFSGTWLLLYTQKLGSFRVPNPKLR